MLKPSRLDGPVCGAVLCKGTAKVWQLAGAATGERRNLCSASSASRTWQQPLSRNKWHCPRSATWIQSTFAPQLDTQFSQRRALNYLTHSTAPRTIPTTAKIVGKGPEEKDKRNLFSYVGGLQGDGNADEFFNYHKDPYRRGYASPDGQDVRVSDNKRDVEYPSPAETPKMSEETQVIITRLCTAIRQRLRHPQRTNLEPIYKLYSQLPEQRMLHLTWQWRNRLMKIMGTPRRKDTDSMLRYFSLVADIRDAGLTLRRTEWNYGLAFASSYAARSTSLELQSTLNLWREMEKDYKVQGNDVTFNILFEVATKAGNFALAEMVYDEMERRAIPPNRYHHVSLIHFFGLKLDSGGVRAAYKEMVEAGEMIDTVVLNCVIAGLLRCGEESGAEHTYERMKEGHTLALDMPQRDYMISKVITRVLMMFTKVGKEHPQMKQSLQVNVPISPDLHTYRLLIEHYAIRVGDLAKVAKYLDEMKFLKIPVHPTIFLALFKGFFTHGGFEGSEWSSKRFDGVLNALYQARDDQTKDFKVDTWVIIWALRAAKKCASEQTVIETFLALEQRWDVIPQRQQFMHEVLDNILRDKDVSVPWPQLDSSQTRRQKSQNRRIQAV